MTVRRPSNSPAEIAQQEYINSTVLELNKIIEEQDELIAMLLLNDNSEEETK